MGSTKEQTQTIGCKVYSKVMEMASFQLGGWGGEGIGSCLEGPPDCQATLEETCRESLEEQGPDWVPLLKTCSLPLAWLLLSHSLGGDMDTLS